LDRGKNTSQTPVTKHLMTFLLIKNYSKTIGLCAQRALEAERRQKISNNKMMNMMATIINIKNHSLRT
jgi:hypothetical protein